MAKKSMGRPPEGRDDVTVRITRPLASQAKALADYRGVPVAQVLSELLEGPLGRAFGQMIKETLGGDD